MEGPLVSLVEAFASSFLLKAAALRNLEPFYTLLVQFWPLGLKTRLLGVETP